SLEKLRRKIVFLESCSTENRKEIKELNACGDVLNKAIQTINAKLQHIEETLNDETNKALNSPENTAKNFANEAATTILRISKSVCIVKPTNVFKNCRNAINEKKSFEVFENAALENEKIRVELWYLQNLQMKNKIHFFLKVFIGK